MKAKYEVICFDVDSTLVTCEGVDWLAEQKGIGKKVKKLTEAAMNGTVAMEDVFIKKIDAVSPSQKDLDNLGRYYCSQITEGAESVIQTLKSLGVDIWLVSGGFLPAIIPLAKRLKIPSHQIHANEIYNDKNGNYKGINHECSLMRSNGKSICAKRIGRGRKIAFVGDGVTDLTTKSVVTTFIGYGGVNVRQKVKKEADYFIKTESLEPLLWLVV